ncbi:MAG: FAD-dependent oxidoreductase [Flammeovirgaceae bacterium]|nr:FAD-dependent oxidoreductase [Flammeovirgaceae bacterium]
MNRRKILKSLGLGLSAGLVLPPWLSSCSNPEEGPEISYSGTVCVIGAGVAGLFVADILISKGIKVKIFEASNRLGGRIRSAKFSDDLPLIADFPVEYGADVIYGSDSKWAGLISLSGVPVVKFQTGATDRYRIDDGVKTTAELAADTDFAAALTFYDNFPLSSPSAGQSIQDVAAGFNMRVQKIIDSWLGNAYGTSYSRIGAGALAQSMAEAEHDPEQVYASQNSFENILISRFSRAVSSIQYNRPVTSIDYSGEEIQVTDQNNQTESFGKVIVTTPLSILKSGDITFSPALPSVKMSSMNNLGMDACVRMLIEFKLNFWDTDEAPTNYLLGVTEAPTILNASLKRTIPNDDPKTMVITVYGSKAEELSALPDIDKVKRVIEELDEVYGGKATLNVRRDDENPDDNTNILFVVKDWTTDPFIKGGISYPKPGATMQDRINLAEPVESKLFFAGEATYYTHEDFDKTGEPGTISGALISAERCAQEVIDSIVNA